MTADEMAMVPVESTAVALWGTNSPRGMTARMTDVADAMKDAIEARGMFAVINQRKYVLAEGWSLVGAMVGVFPRPRLVEEIREEGVLVGFRATVDLVTRDGGVCGGAVALCTKDEPQWRDRDWNQIASMAQTRATAKAYRSTLGFIMPMAGYAATPAEEMDGVPVRQTTSQPRQRPPATSAAPKAIANRGGFLTAMRGEFDMDKAATLAFLGCTEVDQLDEVMEPFESWAALLQNARETLRETAADVVPA